MVQFWAELLHLGQEHEELAAAAVRLCEPEGCRLDTKTVANCLQQLADARCQEPNVDLAACLPLISSTSWHSPVFKAKVLHIAM